MIKKEGVIEFIKEKINKFIEIMIFDKLKQLKEIKKIQDQIKKEKVEVEKEGVKVVMNGNLEVLEIQLNPDLSKEAEEKVLKDCVNQAIRKVQQKAAGEIFKMFS